ncbi:MAG: hypothetical protein WCC86_07185 [Methanoregula sp.]|uniref:hypothetical protein n=1 Tax=Methanoregula sp. TaxID=2052170 RepID=UPI003BAEA13E
MAVAVPGGETVLMDEERAPGKAKREKMRMAVLSRIVLLVARACIAVLHTDLSVLGSILNGNRAGLYDERIFNPE